MTVPRSFTAFRRSLHEDDTVRLVDYTRPWHTRTTTIEALTLHGFQTIANEHGRHGGEQYSEHITWPSSKTVKMVDNGVAFLSHKPRMIWEWSVEYGGMIDTGLWIHIGEPWMLVLKPD